MSHTPHTFSRVDNSVKLLTRVHIGGRWCNIVNAVFDIGNGCTYVIYEPHCKYLGLYLGLKQTKYITSFHDNTEGLY